MQLLNPVRCSTQKLNLGREKELLLVPLTAATAALKRPTHLKFQRPQVNTERRNTIKTRNDQRKGKTTAGKEVISHHVTYQSNMLNKKTSLSDLPYCWHIKWPSLHFHHLWNNHSNQFPLFSTSHRGPVRHPPLQTSPVCLHQEEKHERSVPLSGNRPEHHRQHRFNCRTPPGRQRHGPLGGHVSTRRRDSGQLRPKVHLGHWQWRWTGQKNRPDESQWRTSAHLREKAEDLSFSPAAAGGCCRKYFNRLMFI